MYNVTQVYNAQLHCTTWAVLVKLPVLLILIAPAYHAVRFPSEDVLWLSLCAPMGATQHTCTWKVNVGGIHAQTPKSDYKGR